MRILARQFLGGWIPLDIRGESFLTRAALEGSGDVADRLAQCFKGRVRTAATLTPCRLNRSRLVNLVVLVGSPNVRLLHVEKLVADALVDAGHLTSDRFGPLESVAVYRQRNVSHEWVQALIKQDDQTLFKTPKIDVPVQEWRTITALSDYSLRGKRWTSPEDYHSALLDALQSAPSDVRALDRDLVELLRRLEAGDKLVGKGLTLEIEVGISPDLFTFDLDNAGLFVLDCLARWSSEIGITSEPLALDSVVENVIVRGAPITTGFAVTLKHGSPMRERTL